MFVETWNMACRLDPDSEMVMPGEHAEGTFTLLRTMFLVTGTTFTVRENQLTVMQGIITEILPSIRVKNNLAKLPPR